MPDEAVDTPTPEPRAAAEAPTPAAPPADATKEEDWATRYKYLLADFENFRRRTERDRESISRNARGAMVRELLPLFEAFRSARSAVGELPTDSPLRKGLDLLDREWMTFLKHEGVEPVATVGEMFRSAEEEAIGHTPASEDRPDGSVAEIVQQGYRFYGGLLRPAKVIVARAASGENGP